MKIKNPNLVYAVTQSSDKKGGIGILFFGSTKFNPGKEFSIKLPRELAVQFAKIIIG